MNYFAALRVRQFKPRGTYPSVLPTCPAPEVNLEQELKGKGWKGVVEEEPTETQQRTGAAAQSLDCGVEAPWSHSENTLADPMHRCSS